VFANTTAFSSFAVDDIDRAREFYAETLGIETTAEDMGFLTLHIAGDRPTMIYPKPDYAPATYTVLNFPVDDIDAAVEQLSGRGVKFLRYDEFGQDEHGISREEGGPPIAWFTDPAGNILAVLEVDQA
jgi:predicted enzyme related to lactoylglutathione lyase